MLLYFQVKFFNHLVLDVDGYHTELTHPRKKKKIAQLLGSESADRPLLSSTSQLHLLLKTPLTNAPFSPQQHISGIKAWPFLLNSANLAVFTPELPAEMTEWSGHHSFSPHVHPVSSLFSS